nr:hypothetical protein A152_16340 [Vibrio tasmaniensis 1F-187]
MKLIGKSEKRTRRPTTDEIDLLKEALEEREQRRENKIPYSILLDFSILSCMRVSEVCGIRWGELIFPCNLRYHDLRREGASRLFEKGFTIEEVAQ